MKTFSKIYFFLLSLVALGLLGFGGYCWLKNHFSTPTNPTSPNNHTTVAATKESDFLNKKLDSLAKDNQDKLKEQEQNQKEYGTLDQQIDLNLKKILDIDDKIKKLRNKIEKKEALLKTKKDLSPEEVKKIKAEIEKDKEELKLLEGERKKIYDDTNVLIQRKTTLISKQTTTTKTINKNKKTMSITGSLKGINDEIDELVKAIQYNEINTEKIKTMLPKYKNDYEETLKLNNYFKFLTEQLKIFKGQIEKLKVELKNFGTNQDNDQVKKKKTFKNVYGMEEEKKQFKSIINYFDNTRKHALGYKKIRPMGVLLYGPPGTGKSHLIEALCGEIGVHYIELEPSRFDKTYVGEGNQELENIWNEAEEHERTIIFIDEISGLANREDKNTNQTASNIINNLLTKLDGFKKTDKKIILMGATNHLEKIDSALRSRFQQQILIDSFKKEEIPGFLNFLILNNHFRISYHTCNYLKTFLNSIPEDKKLSNRDWVKILNEAYMKYDDYSFENGKHNENHEVMLPSDLDEALEIQLQIKKPVKEIEKRRLQCEEEYKRWRQGLPMMSSRDTTKVNKKYTFDRIYIRNIISPLLDKQVRLQYPDKVPNNLPDFFIQPFKRWANLSCFRSLNETLDSKLFSYGHDFMSVANKVLDVEVYNCPKYLLEEDKDIFLNTYQLGTKEYHLHFNPVKEYLTIYTEKMNTK